METGSILAGIGMAIWLGILTSISPCPLATNIAAISFIGKNVSKASYSILSGIFYALGRTLVYIILGAILVSSSQMVSGISFFLQQKMKFIMGPFLVLIGILLLDIIKISSSGFTLSEKSQKRIADSGLFGSFGLGALFALSFCPVSAALFFGSTFGLAMQYNSKIIIPAFYGIGTAAPVILFAFIIAFSAHAIGVIFHKVAIFEKWARRISGLVFILAGIYIIISQVFNIKLF
jgi:cytochrome c biogenesis protein CcdA